MAATMYRQGDILIVAVAEVPASARPVSATDGYHILAGGESGHRAHAAPAADASLWIAEGESWWGEPEEALYVRAHAPTRVVHPEHASIPLPPGCYRVLLQRAHMPRPSGGGCD